MYRGVTAYIGLGPGDCRRTPLNSVAAEHERAARRGRRRPRHAEHRRVRARGGRDDRVEVRAARVHDELAGRRDLELRGGRRAAEHRGPGRVDHLRLEVLVEVGVLDRADEGVPRGERRAPARGGAGCRWDGGGGG